MSLLLLLLFVRQLKVRFLPCHTNGSIVLGVFLHFACQRAADSWARHISLASFMIMGLDEGTSRELMTHCNCESARRQSSQILGGGEVEGLGLPSSPSHSNSRDLKKKT